MNFDDEGYDYHGMWDEDAMQDIALNERDAALYEEKQLKKKQQSIGKKTGKKTILRMGNINEI